MEGRPALDVRAARRRVVGKNCCIDVHDHLPPRWVPGASVQVDRGLGQLDECGAAARRRPFTGKCHLVVLVGAVARGDVARGDVASGPDRHRRVCGRSPPSLGPVAAGCALGERVDRGEQMCALVRLQADAEDQHAVVVPPVLELSLQRQGRGVWASARRHWRTSRSVCEAVAARANSSSDSSVSGSATRVRARTLE